MALSSGVVFPRVIGHRGAAAHAPENTLACFSKAKDCGASWVELDVQLSADGVPVVFHDDLLDRTSSGQGLLTDQPYSLLKTLDAGSWFDPAFAGETIPTLETALRHIASLGLGLNIEIKADEARGETTTLAALVALRTAWPSKLPLLLSSFAQSAVAAARDAAPTIPRALLAEELPSGWQRKLESLDCAAINLDWTKLSPALAHQIKAAGYGLLAYTVNSPAQAERLLQWGVDGVFTDAPDRMSRILASSFAE